MAVDPSSILAPVTCSIKLNSPMLLPPGDGHHDLGHDRGDHRDVGSVLDSDGNISSNPHAPAWQWSS